MKGARGWILAGLLWLLCLASRDLLGAEHLYDVRDYGAKGEGKTLCTGAVQKAIDECAKAGGGTVYFPPGEFLSGTIYMKSGVTLKLDAGSTLLGSTDLKGYPVTVSGFRSYTDNYTDKSLIYGEKLEQIAITGKGIIDGQGGSFKGTYKQRPYLIRFIQCKDVVVEDVTIRNSPMWVQHYLACDDVRISGVTVRSHVNGNNDGIDIDCCQRVIVSGCSVDSGDDAIVLKSTSERPCRDVVVSNCILRSTCNALKMGTESNGGFENIILTGCTIYDTRLAGVALEIVDGGLMDRVVVSDMTMNKVGAPIFLRLGNRARPFKEGMGKPGIGQLRNITISNIQASGADVTGCAISGLPEAKIENVTISNIRVTFAGGGTKEDAVRAMPEKGESYPEYSMFGNLPAYGFYCRHIRELKLHNVQIQTDKTDLRSALVCEDVNDLVVDGFDAAFWSGAEAMIRLNNVKGAFVRSCNPKAGTDVFLKLQGPQCKRITLVGNDFSGVGTVAETSPDVPKESLAEIANRIEKK
jgi:polygalacturonase